jgi:single-stranded-DNA-specific exonuclease
MILISIKNNKIILPKAKLNKEKDLFEYLWKLRHDNEDFLKFPFRSYLEKINGDIPNFAKSIEIAAAAISKGQTIGIIGDYDVDGTIATTILMKFFNYLKSYINFDCTYHIPNRFSEGYGPSIFAINHLHTQGVELIITVDSGTTSYKEIDLANELNMQSIVLDHHIVQKETPNASAFVNCQNSENFKYLCGSGVAFVFALQLQKYLQNKIEFPPFDFSHIMDLVAIATVCDFVPLVDLNRSIVHYGLKIINHQYLLKENKMNPAIHMILQYSMYHYNKNTYINSTDLGFSIGPYLNVAGRLKDANMIIKFLLCDNQMDLQLYFFQLQNLWRDRKKIQEDILQSIKVDESEKFILAYDNKIHEGVMGIIAAKLKESYQKPTVVICINGHEGKGSIRSILPCNAGELIELAINKDILIKGGGHGVAGGFSLHMNKLEEFRQHIKEYMLSMTISSVKEFIVDSILSLDGLNKNFYDQLQKIGPFGIKNEDFIFFFPQLRVSQIYIINQKHISLKLNNFTDNFSLKSIWFFAPEIAFETLQINSNINVLANIKYINNKIELYIIDLHLEN